MPDDTPTPLPDTDWPANAPLSEQAAVAQLRSFAADRRVKPDKKLPPERTLGVGGMERSDLCKALKHLDGENRLWRHVAKGNF
jgi:hypothetical protein